MNVWLLIDGKKDGPHHDFEVRSMINNKDLEPETMAWHEGMGAWKPIGEISLFEDSFIEEESLPYDDNENGAESQPESSVEVVRAENIKAHLESLAKEDNKSNYLPSRKYTAEGDPVTTLHDGEIGVFLWRRFFARILDLNFISSILVFTAIVAHREPFSFFSEPKNTLLIVIFFVFYDILCVHLFGTSLGKATLGIRIESSTGPNLGIFRTVLRTLTLSVLIYLFIHPLLIPIFIILCVFFGKKRGRLPWDTYGDSVARALKLSKNHIIGAIIFYLTINIIMTLAIPSSMHEDMNKLIEQTKQRFEQK